MGNIEQELNFFLNRKAFKAIGGGEVVVHPVRVGEKSVHCGQRSRSNLLRKLLD